MRYRFENYCLDVERRELWRGADLVALEPQVFDLLHFLVHNRDRVVSKDDLFANVWNGRVVSDSTLSSRITIARQAIGDNGDEQRLIRTIARKGVRFVGPVQEQPATPATLPISELLRSSVDLPDKPSIAVLPFQNLSSDPEQDYFADGTVDDIITGLSRIKSLFVIARNTTFTYKGRAVDVKQVGRELGVRYVLEGSVRKAGDRMRITAQLIDALAGTHIWAERYDRKFGDIFALQDEIAMRVIGAIEPSLRKAEIDRVKRQRPNNLDAYDLVLRALPFAFARMPKEAEMAIPLLENALKLEPSYGSAHAWLSWCYHAKFSRGEHKQEDRSAAIHHAHAAVMHGNDDATALAAAAFVIALEEHDTAAAMKLFDRALELSNSNVIALAGSAVIFGLLGKSELAIERAERALQLSPFDPLNYRSYAVLANAYFNMRHYQKSADAAQRALDILPNFSPARMFLAASLQRLGHAEEAKAAALSLLESQPSFTIRGFKATDELDPAVFKAIADALREVGLPE